MSESEDKLEIDAKLLETPTRADLPQEASPLAEAVNELQETESKLRQALGAANAKTARVAAQEG